VVEKGKKLGFVVAVAIRKMFRYHYEDLKN
jgi:hypothetical protein